MLFSLLPAPKQKGLDTSVLRLHCGHGDCRGLASAVVYGPNAAGKTTIVGAMDTLRSIVRRGNIRNVASSRNPNAASESLELIPNNTLTEPRPVELGIRFTADGLCLDYSLSLALGLFLSADMAARRVQQERLLVNDQLVFQRGDALQLGDLSFIHDYLAPGFAANAAGALTLAQANLASDELFLMNGFKTMFSARLAGVIANWLEHDFLVVYRADALQLVRHGRAAGQPLELGPVLRDAVRALGADANELGYISQGEQREARLVSLFSLTGKRMAVPAEVFESYGTLRFMNLFPLIVETLRRGSTLVVDEFDASLHPAALMSIIRVFHDPTVNVHGAQLVFNTHNPIFLDGELFRRDEIKFVERDAQSHLSVQYSLADFGTSGPSGVRRGEDYLRNYFVDRYGAIREVDFAPILRKLIAG